MLVSHPGTRFPTYANCLSRRLTRKAFREHCAGDWWPKLCKSRGDWSKLQSCSEFGDWLNSRELVRSRIPGGTDQNIQKMAKAKRKISFHNNVLLDYLFISKRH